MKDKNTLEVLQIPQRSYEQKTVIPPPPPDLATLGKDYSRLVSGCDVDSKCKLTCQNQRRDGITLAFFGNRIYYIDTVEVLMYFLILVLPVNISLRDAWNEKLLFRESIERIVMISGLIAFARMSPTEQVSNLLKSVKLAKKD